MSCRDAFDIFRTDQARLFDTAAGRLIACFYDEDPRQRQGGDPADICALNVAASDLPDFKTEQYVGMNVEVRGRRFVIDRIVGSGELAGVSMPVYVIGYRIPANSLAARRAVQASFFDKSADVLRKAASTDAYGRPVLGVEAVAHTYACTVVPKRLDKEEEQSERPQEIGLRQIAFPWDADVLPTDRVRVYDLVAGARTGPGVLYEITGVQNGVSEALTLTADAKSSE